MTYDIYTDSKNMFSARSVPWMKVGTTIDHDVSLEEAIALGGMDFNVATYGAGFRPTGSKANWQRAKGRVAIVREDTGEFFQFATEDYQPVQYREAFEFVSSINPRFVAAGTLKGGRQGFIVSQLPDKYAVNVKLRDGQVDEHTLYVLLRTSQDLSRGIEISLVTLRHKCMNQLTLPSLTRDAPQMWAIRHTRNAFARMEQARCVITAVDHYTQAFESIVQQLADIDIDFEQASRTLDHVLPDRPKREEQKAVILDAFQHSATVGFNNTGWGLVNAVDEYFEYLRPERGRTDESRFTDGLDGAAHRYSGKTMQLLLH